jgi:DNA-binding transcriptional ArsR family regulator
MTQFAVSSVFGALADPTRQRIVELLSEGPRRPGELASASDTSPSAMSRHLRVLLNAGIVTDERPQHDARARLFRLRPESMDAVHAWLDELKADADQQLASFKRHVERTTGID